MSFRRFDWTDQNQSLEFMSSTLEALRAISEAPTTVPRRYGDPPAVGESDDLTRILGLPRRLPPDEQTQVAMAEQMTALLRYDNPNCQCARLRPEVVDRGQNPCITSLRPVQGWALYEATRCGGMAGFIEAGGGKTGIDILLPMVVPGIELAVLLIRPSDVEQLLADFECWSQHFLTPNLVGGSREFVAGRPRLEVFPYSRAGLPQNAYWWRERKPQMVIGDEVQKLKDRTASSTGRFLRHFADAPDTLFFCHSASLTTREMEDFCHLIALALREGSPVPLSPAVVERWGLCVNPNTVNPADPGSLRRLCANEGESLEHALHRRIVETSGVISTKESSVAAKVLYVEVDPGPIPLAVKDALRMVRAEEKRPDGEELMDQLEVATVALQVACGFFYRWKFPRGEPDELIDRWFNRRQEWHREIRSRLIHRVEGMDSPKLIRDGAERHLAGYKGPLPKWKSGTLAAWREVEDLVVPEPDCVWIDDYLAKACATWLSKSPGLCWYQYREFGKRVAEISGCPRYGAASSTELLEEVKRYKGSRSLVLSLKAHGTGRNLQSFWRMLMPNPPADGGAWEQAVARCHRYGQPRDLVEVGVFRHTGEHAGAFAKAEGYASYIQSLSGMAQKLIYGTKTWESAVKR